MSKPRAPWTTVEITTLLDAAGERGGKLTYEDCRELSPLFDGRSPDGLCYAAEKLGILRLVRHRRGDAKPARALPRAIPPPPGEEIRYFYIAFKGRQTWFLSQKDQWVALAQSGARFATREEATKELHRVREYAKGWDPEKAYVTELEET